MTQLRVDAFQLVDADEPLGDIAVRSVLPFDLAVDFSLGNAEKLTEQGTGPDAPPDDVATDASRFLPAVLLAVSFHDGMRHDDTDQEFGRNTL